MVTAKDVAQFFISKGLEDDEEGISNLKLQKLLYYAKGFHQALFGESLFPESIFAWTHGPVVPDMYHAYKQYGSGPITEFEDSRGKFQPRQLELLEDVWDVFGQFTASKLRNMTHNEKPWLSHEGDASMIGNEELGDYFKTRVK